MNLIIPYKVQQGTLYLDCRAGNKKLRDFYSKSGFDFMGDFPVADYMVSVFVYEKEPGIMDFIS